MALGGGKWSAQDKLLPGTYINFSSAAKASSALSERGIVAVPLILSWGPENSIIELDTQTIVSMCPKLLSYPYTSPEMAAIRELFRHAKKVLAYRVCKSPVKATGTFATAIYGGIRGNDIKIGITANVDVPEKFDVSTYISSELVETQTVSQPTELKENSYVTFSSESTLAVTAATALTGGTDGEAVSGTDHQAFLNEMENYSFNILACPSADTDVKALYTAFTKRMCEEYGKNFQLVAYKPGAVNYEGVIGIDNTASGALPSYGLVYWVAGSQAACGISASLTNMEYDGELTVDLSYTQAQLKTALTDGKFVFHNASGTARVLDDINTLTSVTDEKGEDFKSNQTIRIIFGISNDIAVLFNTRYLGSSPNNPDGRVSLWNDVCTVLKNYEKSGAITNLNVDSVQILPGETKNAVLCTISGIEAVNAMSKLYMNIVVA